MSMSSTARRRFTLIEILVVIAIISILTAVLAMGLGGSKDKAMHKASKALVNKIKIALEAYNSEFRDYPPDGYDTAEKPGWLVDADGVHVGTPKRALRGTAALMYFLCRPLVKFTVVGADPDDERNKQYKRVGPFLELGPKDFSMPGFNPNHPWSDATYWDVKKNCEIIDAYGRPLIYDKVKTAEEGTDKYFQANRFQNTGTAKGFGYRAHPDEAYVFLNGQGNIPIDADAEPSGFADDDYQTILKFRVDPRFKTPGDFQTLIDLLDTGGKPGNGKPGTHAPKAPGAYDLWSMGRSWVDPRDDVTSWGD